MPGVKQSYFGWGPASHDIKLVQLADDASAAVSNQNHQCQGEGCWVGLATAPGPRSSAPRPPSTWVIPWLLNGFISKWSRHWSSQDQQMRETNKTCLHGGRVWCYRGNGRSRCSSSSFLCRGLQGHEGCGSWFGDGWPMVPENFAVSDFTTLGVQPWQHEDSNVTTATRSTTHLQ